MNEVTVCKLPWLLWGFPGGSEVKASASSVADPGSIPGSGRSPGEENGNPLQYSCLENPMDAHSSILAWRIPWTEKPGRLQPMVSKKESDMT